MQNFQVFPTKKIEAPSTCHMGQVARARSDEVCVCIPSSPYAHAVAHDVDNSKTSTVSTFRCASVVSTVHSSAIFRTAFVYVGVSGPSSSFIM